MRVFYNKIDKKDIQTLPRVLFEGRIFVLQSESEAQRAVAYLKGFPVLGIDTETRPSFRKGQTNKVALLQISTDDTCFLFRLNRMGLPPAVIQLLEEPSVVKVGLSLHDDIASLRRRGDFEPQAFVELQEAVRSIGIEDKSLQKLYANFFGQKISKGQQLTNWEAEALTENQQRYAATDAWACVKIFRELELLKRTNDYELQIVPEETVVTES